VSKPHCAGDELPRDCTRIEVRVGELRQLFNAIDPSPFRQRDLDPQAEEFIVDWAREATRDAPLALLVHLERPAGQPDEAGELREAVHEFFSHRERATKLRLRKVLRIGNRSLLIGLVFLAAASTAGNFLGARIEGQAGVLVREGLLIGGWVAMWKPLETFLYDWWPILGEARLFRRLAAMPVRIEYREGARDAWRHDWPAVPAAGAAPQPAPPQSAPPR
jgi:hypothetical protein